MSFPDSLSPVEVEQFPAVSLSLTTDAAVPSFHPGGWQDSTWSLHALPLHVKKHLPDFFSEGESLEFSVLLTPSHVKEKISKCTNGWMYFFFFFSSELQEIIVDYFILGPVPFKALSLLSLLSFVFISEVSDQSGRWVSLISLFFFFPVYSNPNSWS